MLSFPPLQSGEVGTAEVLVVGAGPVGLTLAIELARHGVRCRIVGRLARALPYCRAIGVTRAHPKSGATSASPAT